MYLVPSAWETANRSFLGPEGFIELTCYIPELNETLVYEKGDLMSFTHQNTGSLVSGELPKNHIKFSLDNSDNKWTPGAPRGLERFLSERLKITLRYGFRLSKGIHWIPGGVFYLSEWRTSPNGLEATFAARDLLEYMIDTPYRGVISGTLYDVATRAVSLAKLPDDAVVRISEDLKNYPVNIEDYDSTESVAEILQKCANAAGCVMYQNRRGVFLIEKLDYEDTEYTIPLSMSYSYPEIELSKALKNVSVSYGTDSTLLYESGETGETQTVKNEFIQSEEQATMVAEWVVENLHSRKTISGESRGDPIIDLFDVVNVENKYGTIVGVVITDLTYRFNGAFKAEYKGYVRGSGVSTVVYSGEVFAGEVN